jgi:uncharacterized protein YbjT (DUF2867 family)
MKLLIIGGTGLIGSKLVTKLRERGNDAVAASPDTGSTRSPVRGSQKSFKAHP